MTNANLDQELLKRLTPRELEVLRLIGESKPPEGGRC